MVVAAGPALLLVPALLTLHEPARGASEARVSAWGILRIPTLWWIIASGALLNFIMYAFSVFLASFLMRVHGISLAGAGIAAGFIYAAGGVPGGLIAGRVGDYVSHRRKDGRMLCAALAALISAPLAFFAIRQPAGAVVLALPLLGLCYAFFNMYYGLLQWSIQGRVSPSLP